MKFTNTLKASLMAAFIATAAAGCSSPDYDEYYVKFVVGITPGDDVKITYNDTYHKSHEITGVEKGETVEATIGPVYGGFRASIEASVGDGQAPRYIRIDASMNGAPFQTVEYVENGRSATWYIPISD